MPDQPLTPGHFAFHPYANEAHIYGDNPQAHALLKSLFEACGWKVYLKPLKKRRKKGKRHV